MVDKFYTITSIAKRCISKVGDHYDWDQWGIVIEPSAGNGSFFMQLPVEKERKVGIDILPEHPEIIKQDFFTYSPSLSPLPSKRILVIGNPPFGRVSSLAIKFFHHAAKWADVIAFIVPRTFRRVSVQNKLDLHFHLVYDEEIPTTPCSFTPPMMAKCCFQIWERRSESRSLITLDVSHTDWKFLSFGPKDVLGQPTPPEGADFAIRAYGGKCGEIVSDIDQLKDLRPKSWHWIKCLVGGPNKKVLIERFEFLDYSLSKDTARQNSIGRGELVQLYSESFD
jgi:hypothetical protein